MDSQVTAIYDDVPISYVIMGIKVKHYQLFPQDKELEDNITVNYNLNIHNTFDKKGSALIIKVSVEITNLEDKTVFGNYVSEMGFKLYNLNSWIKLFPNERPAIPMDLHTKLLDTAVSTTRGLLFSKFIDSYIPDVCMPAFDVAQLASSLRNNSSKS